MTNAVVVGSGPNGLAAALTLGVEGVDVTVLEAADALGGGTRSSELTLPGLLDDECSAAHPLAVDTPFSRWFDLAAHGLTWRWPEVQYSHPLDGGRGAAAYRSVDETAAALSGRDGKLWRSVFGWLSERFDDITDDLLRPMLHVPAHPIKLTRFGLCSGMPAGLLARRWSTPEAQALFAGVAAHAFRPFTSPMSSAIGVALGTAAHRYGWPVAEGGSGAISRAMVSALEQLGAKLETGVRVESLDELGAPDIVVLDVTPAAAARIAGDRMPRRIASALTRYRHGPATFKVDFAVEGGVPWTHEPSRRAGTVHVGGTLREIAAKEKQLHQGQMPDAPFVLVCQQYLADPSRSNGDVHPVYSYAHVPAGYTGDATAQIEAQIESFAPGFRDRILARHLPRRSDGGPQRQLRRRRRRHRLQQPAAADLPPTRGARSLLDWHPWRLPVLGGDAARRRSTRNVWLQRGELGSPPHPTPRPGDTPPASRAWARRSVTVCSQRSHIGPLARLVGHRVRCRRRRDRLARLTRRSSSHERRTRP